jgi:hypothetical protein
MDSSEGGKEEASMLEQFTSTVNTLCEKNATTRAQDGEGSTGGVRVLDPQQLAVEMASVVLGGMAFGRLAEGGASRPAMAGVKWGLFFAFFTGVSQISSMVRQTDDLGNVACGGAVSGGIFCLRGK